MPSQPSDFTEKIFEGPQILTSAPMFVAGAPNLSDSRCAWYIEQIKRGTSITSIVPDRKYEKVDPTQQWEKEFPPTYFFHGTADVFVGHEFAVRANEDLKRLGVKTELVLAEGVGHAFDLQMQEGDEKWDRLVVPALEWLVGHV
jgi:acetyl esterase/lipase